MGLLTMSQLSGLGAAPATLRYLKLKGSSLVSVERPPRPGRPGSLSGLGQASECGPAPSLSPTERSQCCPNVGWVIYDLGESEYGLCERAAAASSSGSSSSSSSAALPSAASSDDPFAAVEARRQALEERRIAADEAQFKALLQEAQLRRILGQAKALQQAEAAERAGIARAAADARAAKLAAADAVRRSAQAKQLLGIGAVAFVGAKILKLI